MSTELLEYFYARRAEQATLLLATVVDTEGSTYSKAGERLLIDAEGVYRGLLSGGCLEGDLALRVAEVHESGQSRIIEFDFRGEDDELFGLGTGCPGCYRILLQSLNPENGYEPFASIAKILEGDDKAVCVTALESTGSIATGDSALFLEGSVVALGLDIAEECRNLAEAVADVHRTVVRNVSAGGETVRALFDYLEPAPRFLVLGAGPDTQPLLDIANVMGWRCTVYDHRPASVEGLSGPIEKLSGPADALLSTVDVSRFDRCIIMSHHLASDRAYLRQLADSSLNYIGLLGPPSRKDRLMSELGDDSDRLAHRVHGPAGINFGARGPSVIALSIVAQIQQLLH